MAAKLVAVAGLLLAAGIASAQAPDWQRPSSPPAPVVPLHNVKPAYPTAAPDDIRQVQAAAAPRRMPGITTEQMDYLIQLLPPSPERMFRIYSEEQLHEQLRQEDRERTPKTNPIFPDEPAVTDQKYAPRQFPPMVAVAEPAYVNYKRLYFEDKNSERYGWDLGILQPVVSTGLFVGDLVLLPYHFASRPFDCVQSSAGYCLPGDPVPYLLDPPNLSVTGAVGEAGAIMGLIAIFP